MYMYILYGDISQIYMVTFHPKSKNKFFILNSGTFPTILDQNTFEIPKEFLIKKKGNG